MDQAKVAVLCVKQNVALVVSRLGGEWPVAEQVAGDGHVVVLSRLFDDWTDLQPVLEQLHQEHLIVEWHADWVGVTHHARTSGHSAVLEVHEKE